MSKGAALAEWRTGWPLVASTVMGIIGLNAPTFVIGLLMKPLSAAFGWTRAEISATTIMFSVFSLALGWYVGGLTDRVGSRQIVLLGVPCAGLAIASVSLSGPGIWTWYAAWLFYAPFQLAIGPIPWTSAIARHFKVNRGLALAVGYSGAGIGAAMWPPLTAYLIQSFGWRAAVATAGLSIALLVPAVAFLLFRGAPTGPSRNLTAAPHLGERGLSLRQALGTTIFWRVAIALTVTAATVSSSIVHLPAMFQDKGMSPLRAASVVALIGPSMIVGRFVSGWLLDRVSARVIASGFFLLPALGCWVLVGYDGNQLRGVAAAVLIGLTAAGEGDLLGYLISRYFGLRHFGAVYAVGLAIFGVGYGMAPAAGGALFDRLHSYDLGLSILGLLLVVCSMVGLTFGRYPSFGAQEEVSAEVIEATVVASRM